MLWVHNHNRVVFQNFVGQQCFYIIQPNQNVFIGIAHETLTSHRYFASRVITMEEFKPRHFRLTGMSDRFGIPSHNDDICVDRIHFPSSMMYADDNKETIVISMGYMDCTIHTVKVKTLDLLSSVKPLSCWFTFVTVFEEILLFLSQLPLWAFYINQWWNIHMITKEECKNKWTRTIVELFPLPSQFCVSSSQIDPRHNGHWLRFYQVSQSHWISA